MNLYLRSGITSIRDLGGPPVAFETLLRAQREGSIVSLIADPNALVNNPRKDRENDELWIMNTEAIPPVGAPVRVSFTLE